jgi:hypothetical protein
MAEMRASKRQAAELSGFTMRSQVLCLTAYLDRGTASRAAYLLAALSQACRYHPYELGSYRRRTRRLARRDCPDRDTDAGASTAPTQQR